MSNSDISAQKTLRGKIKHNPQDIQIGRYKNQTEFLIELDQVLRKDYGARLSEKELQKAGRNIEMLLANFL